MADHMFGVLADGEETAGAPGPEPGQTENVDAVHARHAAPLNRIAGAVEDREADIGPVWCEARCPDDGGNAFGGKIEFDRFALWFPERLIDACRWSIDAVCRNMLVYQGVDAIVDPVGGIEIGFQVGLPASCRPIRPPSGRRASYPPERTCADRCRGRRHVP